MSRPRRSRYTRSTPVSRLRSNVAKLVKNADLVANRLKSWQSSENQSLMNAHDVIRDIQKSIVRLDSHVEELQKVGFIPPKRNSTIVIEEGQTVAVIGKYRAKFETAFEAVLKEDPKLLDELVVKKIIPTSGEIVVQRGHRTPFIVRKSHLVLV